MQTRNIFQNWTRPQPPQLNYYTIFSAFYKCFFFIFFFCLFFWIFEFFQKLKKYIFSFFSIPIRLWCYSLFRLLHLSTCFNTTSGDSLPFCYELTGTLTGSWADRSVFTTLTCLLLLLRKVWAVYYSSHKPYTAMYYIHILHYNIYFDKVYY